MKNKKAIVIKFDQLLGNNGIFEEAAKNFKPIIVKAEPKNQ